MKAREALKLTITGRKIKKCVLDAIKDEALKGEFFVCMEQLH